MYAVVIVNSFDADTPLYLFKEEDKAKAFLKWAWQQEMVEEQKMGAEIDTSGSWIDEDVMGKIAWLDGSYTEYILTYTSEIPKEFENKWKKRNK